ncbi:uncharacterized protein LOC132062247 [Lycium ferocissimum]|uniref:uncharacterized protein LOC132062247 n=1 Tax=Lycium ferocissimum TaxID=112874 RepID=UPI0028161AB4|nr:uncharacterized protein LOC132062247 [Lycium ferocissimum]
MPPKVKRRGYQSVSLDILSGLPGNVIDDILMLLPLRDDVKTSILSKNGRLPQLTLDSTHWKMDYDLLSPIIGLKNHLVLELPLLSRYKLPSAIFSIFLLRHTALENCSMPLPSPAFKGSDRLISLELRHVNISSIFLQILIANCPLVEELVLDVTLSDHGSDNVIEINAPMLRFFNFHGNITSVCLRIPRLTKLTLWYNADLYGVGKFILATFFESFSVLEHLSLDNGSIELFVGADEVLAVRLPYILNSVKHFHLYSFCLGELEVACALCLIRSFPYLQYLEMQVGDYDNDIPVFEFIEVEASSEVTFNHLRDVELRNIIGSKPEIQLIKFLLAKSPVLVRMLITPREREEPVPAKIGDYATVRLLVELTKFQHASPKAEVVFNLD